MTSPLVITQLDALESQASQHLEAFKKSYWQFTAVLCEIRETGVWEESECATWELYLTTRWLPHLDVGYTRIRQLQAAYDVMEVVRSVTGVSLNENQIRTLKAIVPDEYRYLLPEIVSRTHAYTSSPAKRHYAATYDVLLERERLASVTVDGQSHSVDVTQSAVLEAVLEADMRQKEHIANSGNWEVLERNEYKSFAAIYSRFAIFKLDDDMIAVVTIKRRKPDVTPVTEGGSS